jgi:hypothetical protein
MTVPRNPGLHLRDNGVRRRSVPHTAEPASRNNSNAVAAFARLRLDGAVLVASFSGSWH